jgi:hypothetical protein
MSTSIGYVVNNLTGESIPVERCLVVVGSGVGRPTVADKTDGRLYNANPAWVFVPGADENDDSARNHPAFRLKMVRVALERGEDLSVLGEILTKAAKRCK